MSEMRASDAVQMILAAKDKSGEKQFGRTALMKHMYFLQEVAGVNLGLEFEMFTWGPFSKEVLEIKSSLEAVGKIEEKDQGPEKGYNLFLKNPNPTQITNEYEKIRKLISKSSPSKLEALSSLHYARKTMPWATDEEVIQAIRNLKPYFSERQLKMDLLQLAQWRWI